MKTLNDALRFMAETIWKYGESRTKGCQPLIPFSWEDKKTLTPYESASKIINKKMKATHFDREWIEKGRSVKLRFYKGECFGACLDLEFIEVKTVKV